MEAKLSRDYSGAKIGMWLFLFSEICFFFGPLVLYTVFRYRHPAEFASASKGMDLTLGTINTVILLTSSLMAAISVSAIKKGREKTAALLIALTAIMGVAFLFIKYVEWSTEIGRGFYPGSLTLFEKGNGEVLYFGLYYFLTGMHGLHVLIGVVLLSVMAVLIGRRTVNANDYIKLENSALYWHLVDIVWIYLFPLFYLVS